MANNQNPTLKIIMGTTGLDATTQQLLKSVVPKIIAQGTYPPIGQALVYSLRNYKSYVVNLCAAKTYTAFPVQFDMDSNGNFKITAQGGDIPNYTPTVNRNQAFIDSVNVEDYDIFVGSPLGNTQVIKKVSENFDGIDISDESSGDLLHDYDLPTLDEDAAFFIIKILNAFSLYQPSMKIFWVSGEHATIGLYRKFLLSKRLKAFISIAHGAQGMITLADGALHSNWISTGQVLSGEDVVTISEPGAGFEMEKKEKYLDIMRAGEKPDLSNMVVCWNSCLTFNDPMKSAICKDAKARTYIAGVTLINDYEGPCVLTQFWYDILKNPKKGMKDSLFANYDTVKANLIEDPGDSLADLKGYYTELQGSTALGTFGFGGDEGPFLKT